MGILYITEFADEGRDANGNDIAEGERGCTGYPRVGCEIDFSGLSSNLLKILILGASSIRRRNAAASVK